MKELNSKIVMKCIFRGILIALVATGTTASIYKVKENKELSVGTVTEKTETDTNAVFSIDTDGNKDTVEKVIILDKTKDSLLINNIQKDSQIKFKDNKKLSAKHIYQIDDLVVKQK